MNWPVGVTIEFILSGLKFDVTKRHNDFHVCLTGKPSVWACGKTLKEATDNCVALVSLLKGAGVL